MAKLGGKRMLDRGPNQPGNRAVDQEKKLGVGEKPAASGGAAKASDGAKLQGREGRPLGPDTESRREFVLEALRSACRHCRRMESDWNALEGDLILTGLALKGRLIDCETAMQWVYEAGALELVRVFPAVPSVNTK